MHRGRLLGRALAIALVYNLALLGFSLAQAATLTNVSGVLNSDVAGANTSITVSFTTVNAVPVGGYLDFAFPVEPAGTGFVLTAQNSCTGISATAGGTPIGGISCNLINNNIGGNVVSIVRINLSSLLAPSSNVVITVDSSLLKNPPSGGSYVMQTVQTLDGSFNTIDNVNPGPTLTVATPVPAPTLSTSAALGFAAALAMSAVLAIRRRSV